MRKCDSVAELKQAEREQNKVAMLKEFQSRDTKIKTTRVIE